MNFNPKPLSKVNMKFFRNMALIFERIFFGFTLIFFVGSIVALAIPRKVFDLDVSDMEYYTIQLRSIHINIETGNMDILNFKWTAFVIALAASVVLFIVYIIARQLRLIFETLQANNPFDEQNSKRIAIIGIMMIIASAVFNLAEYVAISKLIHQFDSNNIDVNYSINGGLFLSGIIVMLLSSVFRYGTYLQNEYDSTL